MKTFRIALTTAAAVAALTTAVAGHAQPAATAPGVAPAATPHIDARQQRQQARIAQGRASGQLSAREAHRLQREQKAIARAKARAKADGVVTASERRHIAQMQNQASRDIRRQKHDAQQAPGALPR